MPLPSTIRLEKFTGDQRSGVLGRYAW